MRRPIIIANWKMNGSREKNTSFLEHFLTAINAETCDIVICPPLPYLSQIQQSIEITAINLGSQNVCQYPEGAYTGETSATMLADLGCQYCLIGHSERRLIFNESDKSIADKFLLLKENNITPVLCVGETLQQRENNETEQVVLSQIDSVIHSVGINNFIDSVIAYEPVWSIGTGLTATPEQAQSVHLAIRNHLETHNSQTASGTRIVYGGSVKPENAADLFSQPDIDGGLIGGASLKAESFAEICNVLSSNAEVMH
ncbi:triose-phosphate isomerase [Sessilibacter corallicola]|uniref:triose-phosphate isomerase n=1 Tax=Sessilibacter corallicola TaxID=2904075 RepID=UPI001E62F975|nr:triose-phosphate isomerase [Sessilibacter corallicola]MCE2029608.1 triose-phosphate isomerase [Sessilibacter corallicola]